MGNGLKEFTTVEYIDIMISFWFFNCNHVMTIDVKSGISQSGKSRRK